MTGFIIQPYMSDDALREWMDVCMQVNELFVRIKRENIFIFLIEFDARVMNFFLKEMKRGVIFFDSTD